MSNSTYENIISENSAIEYQIQEMKLQNSTDNSIIFYNKKSLELINNVNNIFLILYYGFFFIFLIILFFNKILNIYYKIGLSIYDFLAGKLSLGRTQYISKSKTVSKLPTIEQKNLMSGVVYQDGQFDDARLAINLAQTIIERGGSAINYLKVILPLSTLKF